MLSLSEEESENVTKKRSLSDSTKTDPTSQKRIRVELEVQPEVQPEVEPRIKSPTSKVITQNQPEVRDSFYDTLDGESQFVKQITKPEVNTPVPEVQQPEDDSFMKTMFGESQFARPAQPMKSEKVTTPKVDKKVDDSFDETMPGESQFVKNFQKDDLERFFDEPTNVESPKPKPISPFKSPEKRTPRNLISPSKSPRKSPEIISALPPNLSPQTKKRIATEAQFQNQPKPRNLINDFANKISTDPITESSPASARRRLATWSAKESKPSEMKTSTMPAKSSETVRTTRQSDGQTATSSTNIKISKDNFGIKYKPILKEEFDRLRKRIISNKICGIHLNDGKAYFTTFTTKSDTVMGSENISAQRGARTHDRWIKSPTLYRLS